MSPENRDNACVWDILDASRQINEFTAKLSLHEYERDKKLQLAVERLLEIIGEASRRLTDAYRESHPDIPWKSMIAFRNVLAHDYGEIRNDIVWRVVTCRIPELITAIMAIEDLDSAADK
jgi:uncharacterized protein with HEPN domain